MAEEVSENIRRGGFGYLVLVKNSSSGRSQLRALKEDSPKVVVPSSLIWERPTLEESWGRYRRMRTAVTTSGRGSVRRTYVTPLVDSGWHTGTKDELPSRDTSTPTPDGHATTQTNIITILYTQYF